MSRKHALDEILARAKEVTCALEAAGIKLDPRTAGALLYMSVHLTHLTKGRRADFVEATNWLWELIEDVEAAQRKQS